jgi:hypothetical protein
MEKKTCEGEEQEDYRETCPKCGKLAELVPVDSEDFADMPWSSRPFEVSREICRECVR